MPLTTSSTLAGFPDAQNTGVRDGVTLRQVGDMTITTPGAVISGLEIHGTLRIEADNVTVRDCKIVNEGGWNGILIPDGNTGAVVEYCDIIGPINGISGTGTFRFNDFSSNDNGINVYGPSLIQDNYIHDMSGGSDAHYDGIEINGGGGTTIRHNTIINEHGQTSAVMINNDFGAVPGIIIDNNYLAGGGYTIYSDARFSSTDPITGVEITNNYLGQGYWGYYAFMNNTPLVSGNHLLGTTWPTPVSDGSTPIPTPGSGSINEPGMDAAHFNFNLTDATVSVSGNHVIVDGPNGSHTVLSGSSFKTYVFTDGTVNNNDGDSLVDDLFYYSHNHDVWNAHVDADLHYQVFGWHEGRDPNALFDTNGYLTANPDVANAHVDPLVHYHQFGWREGRDPSPAFDTTDYLSHNPDVAAAHVDPLMHYLQFGIDEGRQTFIHGSTGNDILKSTTSSESFLGNGGRDTFVFAANFGNDIIRDFGALGQSHDVLQFSKTVFDSFASVLSHASQAGQDVVISAGSDTLLLKNTTLGALDSPDFRFA